MEYQERNDKLKVPKGAFFVFRASCRVQSHNQPFHSYIMGNAQSISDNIYDTISRSLTNILIQNSQECSNNEVVEQTLKISNIKAPKGCSLSFEGISQSAVLIPDVTCGMTTENKGQLISKLKDDLQLQARAKLSGIGGAINSQSISRIVNKLVNDIAVNIDIQQISKCVSQHIAKQRLSIENISTHCPTYCSDVSLCNGFDCDMSLCTTSFKNISQSILLATVSKCVSQSTNLHNVVNEASTKLFAENISDLVGWNPTSASTASLSVVFSGVVCLCLVAGLSAIGSSSSGD